MANSLPLRNACIVSIVLVVAGCTANRTSYNPPAEELAHYQQVATQIEYPTGPTPLENCLLQTAAPRTMSDLSHVEYQDMTLQETLRSALTNSRVLIDLGGTVLHSPDTIQTNYGIAVQETDAQYGTEAALSAFDAQFATSLYALKNDQQYNNTALGNDGFYAQDYEEWDTSITKRGATGDQYTFRSEIDLNRDTNAGNTFKNGVTDAYIEGEIRHPLLQGAGLDYNRIAGPGAKPGVYNGVLVARIRTDISTAEFETGLRDFVANVENAYWDLYFAYRDLDAKVKARDIALDTWRRIRAQNSPAHGARKGAEDDKEAQAREQYFRFEEDVQNSLVGHPIEGTRTNNGINPGTFRATPGVQLAERRLRLLMGLPPTDCKLLRPADEPTMSQMVFDWPSLTAEALFRREELRRQRWIVKSRELELAASENFLQPNLDLVGRYRLRGYGENLLTSVGGGMVGDQNALANLASADYQEWQVGAEFSMPIGFRQGHAAVRNAELRVSQARAILRQQEQTVISDLSAAVSEVDRAHTVLQTSISRLSAANKQLSALEVLLMKGDEGRLFEVLDAQRRLEEATSNYYQSRVDYVLAIRNVHYEKGSLLEYCDINLSEGSWPDKAYRDATRRAEHRGDQRSIDYAFAKPPVVSAGTQAQILAAAQTNGPAQPQTMPSMSPSSSPEMLPTPPSVPTPGTSPLPAAPIPGLKQISISKAVTPQSAKPQDAALPMPTRAKPASSTDDLSPGLDNLIHADGESGPSNSPPSARGSVSAFDIRRTDNEFYNPVQVQYNEDAAQRPQFFQ